MELIFFNFTYTLLVAIFVGAAGGYLGSLMVLRRMSLIGDALSHVALPGVALALVVHINPFWGAFAALFVGIIIVWGLERTTVLPTESLIGVLFTGSLAIGILIMPKLELVEALFGDISRTGLGAAVFSVLTSAVIIGVAGLLYNRIVLDTISEDLGKLMSPRISLVRLLFLFLVAAVVALGIKVVGALLMGALVIIPAAAARNASFSLRVFSLLSLVLGSLAAAAGVIFSSRLNLPPGPLIILAAGAIFILSLFLKRRPRQ